MTERSWSMRVSPIFLSLGVAAWLAAPAIAQQQEQPAAAQALQCDTFAKNSEGDWFAKKATTVPGPDGMKQVDAGVVLSDDMQDRLDAQCNK